MIFIPHTIRHRETGKFLLNGQFNFNISFIIVLKQFPFVWIIGWHITGSATIRFGRLAWNTKVFDEVFAFFQFLLFKTKHCTDTFK